MNMYDAVLDSAFLTCVIVSINGRVCSFKVDSVEKVRKAFHEFSLDCGFGWGAPGANHSLVIREGEQGWSVTATAISSFERNCNGAFTATGDMPQDIRELVSGRKPSARDFVRGKSVVTGNPFGDPIEFESKTKAKKFAKRHRHELRKEHDAWDY